MPPTARSSPATTARSRASSRRTATAATRSRSPARPAWRCAPTREYVIDARKAERLRPPRVEGQDTEPRAAVGITYSRQSRNARLHRVRLLRRGRGRGRPGLHHADGGGAPGVFETTFKWRLEPTGRVRPGAPDAYELLFNDPRFPRPAVADAEPRRRGRLARVDTTYRPVGPPGEHTAGLVYESAITGIAFVSRRPQAVPATTRTLMTAAPDVTWAHCLGVAGEREPGAVRRAARLPAA